MTLLRKLYQFILRYYTGFIFARGRTKYFCDRPDDLLVINLADPDAYAKFIHFLGCGSSYTVFPWENKT